MAALARELAVSARVYNVDLPGHGDTPHSDSADFSVLAAALAGFLEEEEHDLREVVLVGHSMGGVLSLMAAAESDRVAAVINIDGALPLTARALEAYAGLFEDIQRGAYHAIMEPYLRRAFFLPSEHGHIVEGILAEMLAAPEAWAVALLSQFPRLDASATLPKLHVPTLFIGSDVPRFDEVTVRSLNPRIKFAHLAGHGHFLPVFATDQVAALIRNFL
jgi:pimeloyl-ACP methyl ester carboxylesterase